MTFNLRDVIAGLLFVAIGGWFVASALDLELGTALRMGPGYFPLILACLLILLGLLVVVRGTRLPPAAIGTVPWRGALLILMAPVLFGLTVRGLGFVPALAIVVLVSSFGSRAMKPVTAVLVTVALTLFSILVFSYGLGLPLRRFGPWLGF